jgi:hypothetical protein
MRFLDLDLRSRAIRSSTGGNGGDSAIGNPAAPTKLRIRSGIKGRTTLAEAKLPCRSDGAMILRPMMSFAYEAVLGLR